MLVLVLEKAVDWATFSALADNVLLSGWGVDCELSGVVGFLAPISLQHFPPGSRVIPPVAWQQSAVPADFAGVVLTISRKTSSSSSSPSFRKVGECAPLAELQAKARAGLVRVVVEIDLAQRPHPQRMSLPAFGRRALADLVAKTPDSGGFPSFPLQGLRLQGDMLSGFVDIGDSRAGALLRASGSVRGVFARPWVSGEQTLRPPSGFTATSHRVVWAKVQKFSDLVHASLKADSIPFDGLVCPRRRGEVGVRLPAGGDAATVAKCLTDGLLATSVKSEPRGEQFFGPQQCLWTPWTSYTC